ncbi:Arm DNA-binding domain-containing protein, partial [Bacteroides uniformis]|uniref:Arm DNA-binding domain-containing protein n=1 Tax=Bacteroides uniformis TaxID=820 RepID=UPI0019217D90
MKVRKELFKSKTLANGEHPIAIRIHHKKAKLIMTGVSTKTEYWNKEKLAVKCWKIQCKLPPKTKRFCPLKTFNNAPL